MAARLRVWTIDFEEAVPKQELFAHLQQSHAFIMHLRDSPVFQWGISPNKLYDYFACARPVVFAVNSPHNPVAEADAGVTCAAQNPRALADAIIQLAQTPTEEQWRMGMRGYEHAREHYDTRTLAARLESELLPLCAPRKANIPRAA